MGLELSRRIGYPGTFAFGGAMVLVACLLCVFLPKGQQTAREPLKIKWSNVVAAEVTGPAIMMALLALPYMCINYYMAIYGEARGVEEIGLFFTAYAVALLVSRPIGGMVSDRFGFTASMIPGYALFALAFFLIASASTLPMFIVSGVITAFGYGTVFTNIQSLGMRNVRPSRRGVSANTLYAGMDAGTLLAGPFSGAVCEYFYGRHGDMALAYAGVYQVMVIPIVLACWYIFSTSNAQDPHMQRKPPKIRRAAGGRRWFQRKKRRLSPDAPWQRKHWPLRLPAGSAAAHSGFYIEEMKLDLSRAAPLAAAAQGGPACPALCGGQSERVGRLIYLREDESMYRTFEEMAAAAKLHPVKRRMAVAGAADEDVLRSVIHAKRENLVEPILVGESEKIKELLRALDENPGDFLVEDAPEGRRPSAVWTW